MLARISARLADLAQRVVPDPFVIALGLTLVAVALGLAVMPDPDLGVLASGWSARAMASGTLAFTTQMTLVLVAGAALARAPAVATLLRWLAARPRTSRGAAALTAFVAMIAALINWGFGLVAGAVLAREIGDRARAEGRPLDYPLVGAAGYTGLLVWHGGLSGSAPLKVTEGLPGGGEPVPIDATILSPLNGVMTLAMLLVIPWLVSRMASDAHERLLPPRPGSSAAGAPADPERRPLLGALLGLAVIGLGALAVARDVAAADVFWQAVGLDTVIVGLTLSGLLLHGTPIRYARAFTGSVGEAGGILLQFPFYFGILGVLEASGAVGLLAERSAGAARGLAGLGLPLQWSFDMVTFASAGLVNLFVPSGGGQWAVQGTIVTSAAAELGLPVERAVMTLAYGDQWTNMLQPFWALALLGITGLRARDILGYTLVVMLAAAVVFGAVLAVV